ncbi:MAG: chorismate synthase [Methanomicrobiales archaeon]|nr:chorismate synthase [Methanomicrobiales archaeon]
MNTFGKNFRCTTFGESHGRAIGVVIDGCPPGIALAEETIQPAMDRRRPGTGLLVSQRAETDRVEILSGVFEGCTTGAPICIMVHNVDVRSSDYDDMREIFRPGHADVSYFTKYGIRDHRGGGRSSGRETAGRVAAGSVAEHCLSCLGIRIEGRLAEAGGMTDPDGMQQAIAVARDAQDSIGGIIEIVVRGCPAGLGDPVFAKMGSEIAAAMMGIGGVKGVEIGEGFRAARMRGSEHNDAMYATGFTTNHAGGMLGGITTGSDIRVRIAVKPTPSIGKVQHTVDAQGKETEIRIRGRHDPCIAVRIVPVAEAMLALVLMDRVLEQAQYEGFRAMAGKQKEELR